MALLNIENLGIDYTHVPDIVPVVNNVSLQVGKNEFHCLLEVSGNSSCSLLNAVAGKQIYEKGKIFIRDIDIITEQPKSKYPLVCYFRPAPLFSETSSLRVAEYLADTQDYKKGLFAPSRKSLKKNVWNHLVNLHTDLEKHFDSPIRELSMFERVQLSLIPLLFQSPSLLLVDTLNSSLPDYILTETAVFLQKIYNHSGLSILMNSHYPQQAFHLAEYIHIFCNGEIVQQIENREKSPDTLANLFKQVDKLREQIPLTASAERLLEEQYI